MLPKRKTSNPSQTYGSGDGRRPMRIGQYRRKGAVFSVEMMMVITVLVPLMFALTEFSLLWSAKHLLEAAAYEAARAAAMPADDDDRCLAAEDAVRSVVVKPRLQEPAIAGMNCDTGSMGGMVHIQLQIPMTAASPDMLGIIGISIEGKFLTAEAVTARQN